MNAAFLFDPAACNAYGPSIIEDLLSLKILQNSNRKIILRSGDLLFYQKAKSRSHYRKLNETALGQTGPKYYKLQALADCINYRTIYCICIENTDSKAALLINERLMSESSYIGFHRLDFGVVEHAYFYRNLLTREFRIEGEHLGIFYTMGNLDTLPYRKEDAISVHFTSVEYEDQGARGTFLDEFDTPEYYDKVNTFRKSVEPHLGSDSTDDLVLALEDTNPRLFNPLASATKALARAEFEEDLAHVGVSIRRFIEHLADSLLAPRATESNSLTKEKYRNRIWKFIEEALGGDSDRVREIGREMERLDGVSNKSIHFHVSKDEMERLIIGVCNFCTTIIDLDRQTLRNSQIPYADEIDKMLQIILRTSDQ
jgi:hypothetical protein